MRPMASEKPHESPAGAKRTPRRPARMRPLRTQQEMADEHGAESLVGIDNPDDADLYPPTETPPEGEKRRRKDFAGRAGR